MAIHILNEILIEFFVLEVYGRWAVHHSGQYCKFCTTEVLDNLYDNAQKAAPQKREKKNMEAFSIKIFKAWIRNVK